MLRTAVIAAVFALLFAVSASDGHRQVAGVLDRQLATGDDCRVPVTVEVGPGITEVLDALAEGGHGGEFFGGVCGHGAVLSARCEISFRINNFTMWKFFG